MNDYVERRRVPVPLPPACLIIVRLHVPPLVQLPPGLLPDPLATPRLLLPVLGDLRPALDLALGFVRTLYTKHDVNVNPIARTNITKNNQK